MADDRTNNIDTPTLFDDVLKTSKSASQFGPVRVSRLPEIPPDSFGRNGDLVIIDNTAVPSTEIAADEIPSNVAFCQKIPAQVPDGPNQASSTSIGADLVGGDQFTINGAPITLPAGSVFVKDAADAVNTAALSGISAIGLTVHAQGTVTNPTVLPGDQLIINGVNIIFPQNGGITYIASQITAASVPFIVVSTTAKKISLTHTQGGTVTLGGTNLAQIMGTPVISGGTLTIVNEEGTQVTLADVIGTPLATMGFPTTIPNSPLTLGGTWQCFDTNGINIKDSGTPLGVFETIDFTGPGVTVTDLGGGEVQVNISGGGGGSQNLWETIVSDLGSTVANTPTDTLTISGGTSISTAIVGDTLTITNDSPNVDQNLVDTFTGDAGSFTAITPTDTFNIVGAGTVSTAVVGNTITITGVGGAAQNLWQTVAGDVGSTAASSPTDTLNIVGAGTVTTAMVGNTMTITGAGGAGFTEVTRIQAVYVGKHGNDVNDGLTPNRAKLTFGSAIAAATTQVPSTTNRISIIDQDGGTYTENFTVPSWVLIKAPNSSFVGNIILSDNSEFVFQEASATAGDVISKPAGTATAWVTGEIVRSTLAANSIVNGAVSSILIIRVRQIFTENGTGVLDQSAGPGHVHLDVEDMYITGTGTAIDRQTNTGIVVGRVSHILEIGGGIGVGTAFDITNGNCAVNVGTINTNTAYNVAGTGTLNIFANEINPASQRNQLAGSAVVNVIEADTFRWRNQNANFNARRIEFVSVDTSTGAVTMNLPNPASNGDSVTFQDTLNTFTVNNFTVDAGVGGLIDDGGVGSQTIVLDVSGTAGVFIYNTVLGLWTLARIQEEVAFSPDNVIYVTKNGNDIIGTGSFSNPFLTVKRGVQEALSVALPTNPTTVKVLDGIYDEINPINITGANSEFVQVQGSEAQSTIIRPTINGQALFDLSSNVAGDGPSLSRMGLQGQNNGGTDYKTVVGGDLLRLTGDCSFFIDSVSLVDGHVGINAGNGTITTSQVTRFTNGAFIGNTTGLIADGSSTIVNGDSIRFANNDTAILQTNGSVVELFNFEWDGDEVFPSVSTGVGLDIFDDSRLVGTGGLIRNLVNPILANDTSIVSLQGATFSNNTVEFNQVDPTARLIVQGTFSKTKQLITDGSLVSLNYVDSDSVDFIVGNADATGDPGKEFRVRDFDGRVAIGDNATDANIASGGVGGSRSINLIDENGNIRVWRFVSAAGQDPSMEWIKGINPANPDGDGDAPIAAITAATDTITVDVSAAAYDDPITGGGIDRTTLAGRAFPPGRVFRVNGTASNDGDYTVVSSTYNSGPETIDVVVTTDITVDEAIGTAVFGGGAGRTDGVSTFIGDPGGAVGAGVGNVWWDMFLQETDSWVVRRRTGGGGGLDDEKVRIFSDSSEWLGSTLYDNTDNALIFAAETTASAVNNLRLTNAPTGVQPAITAEGTDTNIGIQLLPKGTGTLTVTGTTDYETNVVDDDDIPNKAYVDAGDISTVSTINGQPVPTFVDTTRTKTLSVSESTVTFSESTVVDLDWFDIGTASNALTGYIAPLQGTIVYASYHCEEDNANAKELDLYINGVLNTTLFTMPGAGGESSATLPTVDIDFAQGDKIQMRSGTTGGNIEDTVITLWIKWRV